jgi:hypothetical protein
VLTGVEFLLEVRLHSLKTEGKLGKQLQLPERRRSSALELSSMLKMASEQGRLLVQPSTGSVEIRFADSSGRRRITAGAETLVGSGGTGQTSLLEERSPLSLVGESLVKTFISPTVYLL